MSFDRNHNEHSAGVRVNETNIENMMAAAETIPKLSKYCPSVPVMKTTGKKMTTNDNVVAITARPISLVASAAASRGLTPFSST